MAAKRRIDYVLICIFGLIVVLLWFTGTGLYFGGDMIYPLRPILNVRNIMFTWTDINGGTSNALSIALYFFYLFFYAGAGAGLPLYVIQRIFLLLNFVLPGLGMYFLSSVVYPKVVMNRRGQRVACWVAALSFMLSPNLFHQPQLWWFYGVFPFIFGFFIKTIDASSLADKVGFSLLAALFSFGLAVFLPEYQTIADLLFVFLLYSLGYWVFNRETKRKLLQSWLVFGSVTLLLNLGVLLPWLVSLFSQGSQILGNIPIGYGGLWLDQHPQGLIRNIGLIVGLGPDSGNFQPTGFYYTLGSWLYLVNFGLVALAFSAVLLWRSRLVLFFALVAITGIAISNGPNPPFGDAYKWLLENFLIFRGYRTVAESNVLVAMGYSVLIGISVATLQKRLGRSSFGKRSSVRYGIVGVVVFLVLVNGWPMLTGAYYNTPPVWPNNVSHSIPTSYVQLDQWLNGQDSSEDYRLLSLPVEHGYQSAYWPSGYYFGVPVMQFLTSKPVIYDVSGRLGVISQVVNLTYGLSVSNPSLMAKAAGLLNVRYFYFDNYTASQTLFKIYNQSGAPGFTYQTTFDKLEVYSINENLVFPRVYAATDLRILNGSTADALPHYLASANFSSSKPVLFVSGDLGNKDLLFVRSLKLGPNPAVSFVQIDPTRYEVQANSSSPFFLVLSSQFDPYWAASVNGAEVNTHLVANGFANSWYIDKEGSFTVELTYKNQDYFHYGLTVSGLSVVGCLLIIKYDVIRARINPKSAGGRSNESKTFRS